MSTTEFIGDEYTVGCPPQFRTEVAEYLEWLPLQDIFESDKILELSRDSGLSVRGADSYLQAWYAFHYFAENGERQRQLAEYLRLWEAGTAPAEAIRDAFGITAAELDAAIKRHGSATSFECIAIKPKRPLEVPTVSVRPLSAGEAQYYVGDLVLNLFGPTESAMALLGEAEKELKSGDQSAVDLFVSLGHAHVQLALTSGDAQQLTAETQQARRYLSRAKQLAGDRPGVLALEGDVLQTEAKAQWNSDSVAAKSKLLDAREAYRQAIRAGETFANAYYELGTTYLIDDNGSKEAQVVLEAAAYILPLDTDIPWALARVHLQRKQGAEAIPVLERVLFSAHSGQHRAAAAAALAELRRTGVVKGAAAAAR